MINGELVLQNGNYYHINDDYMVYCGDGTHDQSVMLPSGKHYEFGFCPKEGQIIWIRLIKGMLPDEVYYITE